jgi:hypothetical protein
MRGHRRGKETSTGGTCKFHYSATTEHESHKDQAASSDGLHTGAPAGCRIIETYTRLGFAISKRTLDCDIGAVRSRNVLYASMSNHLYAHVQEIRANILETRRSQHDIRRKVVPDQATSIEDMILEPAAPGQ